MRFEDHLPIEVSTADHNVSRVLYLLLAVTTTLGAAHHIDHIIRGNHVGWPITHHVNAFTYSLLIYPIVGIGLYLTLTNRVGDRYWAGVFTLSAFMLAYFHISPWAVEPPQDVILPYANPILGYLAFVILLGLIAAASLSVLCTRLFSFVEKRGNRQSESNTAPDVETNQTVKPPFIQ